MTTPDEQGGRADARRVGSNIRYLRQEDGLTQSGLAEAMRDAGQTHWHQTTVSRIERGAQTPTAAELLTLEKLLGTGLLFGTEDDQMLQYAGRSIERKFVGDRLRHIDSMAVEYAKLGRQLDAMANDLTTVVGQLRDMYDDPKPGGGDGVNPEA